MDIAQQLATQQAGSLLRGKPTLRNWDEQAAQKFSVDENGVPKLKIYDFGNGGQVTTLSGAEALANAWSPEAKQLRVAYGMTPKDILDNKFYGDDDTRNSFSARTGRWLHNFANDPEPSFIGRIYDSGPIAGSAVTAGAGWAAGKLADMLLGEGAVPKSLIGLLGGGVLGGIVSHIRKKASADEGMEKESAMFQNPRNFILEKLQGANDLTPIQKAQLANKVRMMDSSSAERLKAIVRAAAGFGVGSLIAKFFFGATGWKAAMGGVVGAVANVLSANLRGATNGQSFAWGVPNYRM